MYQKLLVLVLLCVVADAAKKTFSLTLKRAKNAHHGARRGKFLRGNRTMMKKFGGYRVNTEDNEDYFAEISFGSDSEHLQTFNVLLDTGSAATWVPHRKCKTYATFPRNCKSAVDGDAAPDDAQVYRSRGREIMPDFKASYEYEIETEEGYESAEVIGRFVYDDIWFGSGDTKAMMAEGFKLGLGDLIKMSTDYGILGLSARTYEVDDDGFDDNGDSIGTHFLAMLGLQLEDKVFTLFYQHRTDDNTGGRITFGEFDSDHCGPIRSEVDALFQTPLGSPTANWLIEIGSLTLNGEKIEVPLHVIVDSGAPDLHVPLGVLTRMLEVIQRDLPAEYLHYDRNQNPLPYIMCTHVNHVQLQLEIGGMRYPIPASAITEPDEEEPRLCKIHIAADESYYTGKPWLLGVPWFRSYCNHHDFGRMRIGFARILHHEDNHRYLD